MAICDAWPMTDWLRNYGHGLNIKGENKKVEAVDAKWRLGSQ